MQNKKRKTSWNPDTLAEAYSGNGKCLRNNQGKLQAKFISLKQNAGRRKVGRGGKETRKTTRYRKTKNEDQKKLDRKLLRSQTE